MRKKPPKISARKGGQSLALNRGKAAKRKKASHDEIQERQRMVMRMRMRGMGYRAIANELNVGHMTVKRDLEAIRQRTKERISKFERDYALSETLSVYEEIESAAWSDYNSAGEGSKERASFLAQIRQTRNDQAKLLMDVGLIDRVAQEVKHKHEHANANVIQDWTPAAQNLVALAIVKAGMQPLAEPEKDVIDIPQLPETTEGSTGTDG